MQRATVITILGVMGLSLLLSCGPPAGYDKDDIVTITGKFLDENGDPYKDKQIGIWVLDLQGISLNNYWYPDPDDYEITESDGGFKIKQKGERYLWANGTAKYVIIANIDSLAGPVTAMGFFVINRETELPDARLWKAEVSQTLSDDTVSFAWNAADDAAGAAPDRYSFSSAVVYWDLWTEDDVVSGFKLPTYIFQNNCNGWRIQAHIDREDDNGIDWSYMSETKSGTNLLPNSSYNLLSKGKPAYAAGKADTNYTKLTNQVWHEWEDFGGSHPAWVMLDLGESVSLNAVVVYGLFTTYTSQTHTFNSFEAYVSDDTTDWGSAVATNSLDAGYLRFDFAPVSGRYVKFQANQGSNIQIGWIRELAAFGAVSP